MSPKILHILYYFNLKDLKYNPENPLYINISYVAKIMKPSYLNLPIHFLFVNGGILLEIYISF